MQALKSELDRMQRAMSKLTDNNGIVRPYNHYRYQSLAQEAEHINGCIKWFTKLKGGESIGRIHKK